MFKVTATHSPTGISISHTYSSLPICQFDSWEEGARDFTLHMLEEGAPIVDTVKVRGLLFRHLPAEIQVDFNIYTIIGDEPPLKVGDWINVIGWDGYFEINKSRKGEVKQKFDEMPVRVKYLIAEIGRFHSFEGVGEFGGIFLVKRDMMLYDEITKLHFVINSNQIKRAY